MSEHKLGWCVICKISLQLKPPAEAWHLHNLVCAECWETVQHETFFCPKCNRNEYGRGRESMKFLFILNSREAHCLHLHSLSLQKILSQRPFAKPKRIGPNGEVAISAKREPYLANFYRAPMAPTLSELAQSERSASSPAR